MAGLTTYDTIGIREDLSDIIYNISPTDTPFMSGIGKTKATNTKYDWQTDTLSAVAANAAVEGAAISYGSLTSTTLAFDYTQISTKAVQVTGTDDAVLAAGRSSELAYQVAKAAKELKRDMENALLSNTAKAVGDNTTARTLGGLPTWISTNVSAGAGGSVCEARPHGSRDAGRAGRIGCGGWGGTATVMRADAVRSRRERGRPASRQRPVDRHSHQPQTRGHAS